MKPEHVKIMFRLVFRPVSLFLRICQLVIGMMRSGHFVQRTADQVNKHPNWFMCVLTFQGLGLPELNGTVRTKIGIFLRVPQMTLKPGLPLQQGRRWHQLYQLFINYFTNCVRLWLVVLTFFS